jgi:hypothetical protein
MCFFLNHKRVETNLNTILRFSFVCLIEIIYIPLLLARLGFRPGRQEGRKKERKEGLMGN